MTFYDRCGHSWRQLRAPITSGVTREILKRMSPREKRARGFEDRYGTPTPAAMPHVEMDAVRGLYVARHLGAEATGRTRVEAVANLEETR